MKRMEGEKRGPIKAPLSDQTNFTVPTTCVFHKLKSSLSKNPNSKSRNNNSSHNNKSASRRSKSNCSNLPINHHNNSTNVTLTPTPLTGSRWLEIGCSDSKAGIRLSDFNELSPNSRQDLRSRPRRAPLADIGNRSGVVFEPVYRRKKAPENTKGKGKELSVPLSLCSAEKTKVKGKATAGPSEKRNHLDKVISVPTSCTSTATKTNIEKENVEPFTCPPFPRTRRKRTISDEAGNMPVSHSLTAPCPKRNKNKSRYDLPPEYVEQQRAYFKEVDDFELVEEEASENDSDNEDTVRKLVTQ